MENTTDYALKITLYLFFFGLFSIIFDAMFADKVPFTGIVVDKQYKPESTHVTTGAVATSAGGSGTIVTVETDPQKFNVMVRLKSGVIITSECEPQLYYALSTGSQLNGHHFVGLFTGLTWGSFGDSLVNNKSNTPGIKNQP